jgi:hypothetical protein
MKKVLLAGTALLGVAVLAVPAHAELKTELGGFFRGYGVYANNDENIVGNTAGDSLRQFEFRRDSEIHFNGETTLDNGLTVGAHTEMQLGQYAYVDETYAYFSGGWGRVNFGNEDGAAYLLQVAIPSADSNVDGLRPVISGINSDVWVDHFNSTNPNHRNLLQNLTTYQVADFSNINNVNGLGTGGTERMTYLTPKFNGFQAGVSYAPRSLQSPNQYTGLIPMGVDNFSNQFDQLWEGSARWDGEFQGFGISLGGGYSHGGAERGASLAGAPSGSDDINTWNVGTNVTWSGFSLGGAYKSTNNGIDTGAAGTSSDTRVWTAGLGWDNGPYHLGASYLDGKADDGAELLTAGATSGDVNYHQYVLGGGYTFGPGMTFRGAYKWGQANNKLTTGDVKTNFQQATLGTDIQF